MEVEIKYQDKCNGVKGYDILSFIHYKELALIRHFLFAKPNLKDIC